MSLRPQTRWSRCRFGVTVQITVCHFPDACARRLWWPRGLCAVVANPSCHLESLSIGLPPPQPPRGLVDQVSTTTRGSRDWAATLESAILAGNALVAVSVRRASRYLGPIRTILGSQPRPRPIRVETTTNQHYLMFKATLGLHLIRQLHKPETSYSASWPRVYCGTTAFPWVSHSRTTPLRQVAQPGGAESLSSVI